MEMKRSMHFRVRRRKNKARRHVRRGTERDHELKGTTQEGVDVVDDRTLSSALMDRFAGPTEAACDQLQLQEVSGRSGRGSLRRAHGSRTTYDFG